MWQLPISITKCFAMIVGRQPSFDVRLSIDRISVPYVTSCKDLGVTVCSSFNNSSHIANIVSIAGQRSQLLLRSFASRDLKILTRAFITYVRPILEYNSVIWSPIISLTSQHLNEYNEGSLSASLACVT